MAYMVSVKTTCDYEKCRKPHSHGVYSQQHGRMGFYCKRHAEVILKSLQESEDRRYQPLDQAAALPPAGGEEKS
jgi:hypothetical protein